MKYRARTPEQLLSLHRAHVALRNARDHARLGGATRSVQRILLAMKSLEGAIRHAGRMK